MDENVKQNSAQKRAQTYFTQSGREGVLATESRSKKHQAEAEKIRKLRALRLAKEEADKSEADRLAGETPAPAPRRKSSASKSVKVLRIHC
jgi:hypothetical protein